MERQSREVMDKITVSYKNLWLSSDLHIGHFNVIEYSGRPFSSSSEMTEALINNWNSVITKESTAIICGDLTLSTNRKYVEEIIYRLNGDIHLVIGNHDKWLKHSILKERFSSVGDMLEINVSTKENKSQQLIACHYAMQSWPRSHHGSWHVYGHSHQRTPVSYHSPLAINVGVDAWNYMPVSYEQIEKIMKESGE
jgi:calcineurin-like phosphoesterase family protein